MGVRLAKKYDGSIVIPVLNEADGISNLLQILVAKLSSRWKLIVVDGGSDDGTQERIRSFPVTLLSCERGRAKQMNMGAQCAEGKLLVFLHADSRLPTDFELQMSRLTASDLAWGRFDVTLAPASFTLKVVSWFINQRSKLTGIATGDQAMFIRADLFESLQGFPDIPLMEDIAMSKQLKRHCKPFCISSSVVSSSRRWRKHGLFKTIILMWWLRLAYFVGVPPRYLHRLYYPKY